MITLYEKIIAKKKDKEVKVGSIILSEPKLTELVAYEVISVGHGVLTMNGIKELQTKVGDTVYTMLTSGVPFSKDDIDYRLLKEADVGILEKK